MHRSRLLRSLLLLLLAPLLVALAPQQRDPAPGGTATPPPGRPPEGALTRSNPKTYDIVWDVLLSAPGTRTADPSVLIDSSAFLFPVIPFSTWNSADLDSMRINVTREGRVDSSAIAETRLDRAARDGVGLAVIPLGTVRSQALRCTITQRVTVWRSDLDDAAAAKVSWPAEWPAEAQAWLAPSPFVESDDPRFAAFVERTAQGRLRYTPVFVAAKELIRATIKAFNGIDGPGLEISSQQQVHGLRMSGAASSMQAARGTVPDLVAACVAVLRAAGIPARPVIGVDEASDGTSRAVRTTYRVWAEFFLPGSGWVPFDPDQMRGTHAMSAAPERSWTGLGRMKDLNTRVPLAYSFRPMRGESLSLDAPGGWGLLGRNAAAHIALRPFITLQMTGAPIGPASP